MLSQKQFNEAKKWPRELSTGITVWAGFGENYSHTNMPMGPVQEKMTY